MADPPPIRRPTMPPPIPRLPIAPAPARTDVVPIQRVASDEATSRIRTAFSEDTRNVEAPDASQLVARMLDLVASEAEALLVGDDADGRLADLNVRTALASWDGLHQPDEAMRHLELAESHPLAPRLRLSAALGGRDPAALTAAQTQIDACRRVPPRRRSRSKSPRRGCFAIRRARPRGADRRSRAEGRDSPRLARRTSSSLAALAHAAAGNWARVVEIRRAALTDTSPSRGGRRGRGARPGSRERSRPRRSRCAGPRSSGWTRPR